MLYHMVMARKQVLVQLDDAVVKRLDRLAGEMGVSRSELLRRGALAVLESERIARAERDLIEAYRSRPADPALVESARRLAAETAPEW
jgi:predicted transcriptional regulator